MRRDLKLYTAAALGTTAVYAAVCLALSLTGRCFSVWFAVSMPWITLALLVAENAVVVLAVRYIFPKRLMNPERRRFAVGEREARVYARFGVRKWSPLIPELGQLANFRKDKIRSDTPAYLYRFLEETAYAELMHEWSFVFGWLPALVFGQDCLFCTIPMCAVNLLMQVPPVMIQRYNRPKLKRLYEKRCRQESSAAPVGLEKE